jgi:hypothetical protein
MQLRLFLAQVPAKLELHSDYQQDHAHYNVTCNLLPGFDPVYRGRGRTMIPRGT